MVQTKNFYKQFLRKIEIVEVLPKGWNFQKKKILWYDGRRGNKPAVD